MINKVKISMPNKIKVAVLMGGPSEEHEVSLDTGKNVLKNIDKKKYEAQGITINKEGNWEMSPEELKKNFDVVFVAMHGPYGEDGMVQAELEAVGVPYTGSDAQTSALCMNKHLSLKLLQDAELTVPQTMFLDWNEWLDNRPALLQKAKLFINPPYVIKPNRSGSSLDVIISANSEDIEPTLMKLFEKHHDLIIQPFINGREVACGVLDCGVTRSAYPLPPIEIIPKLSHFFDYESKYKMSGADEIVPARFSDSWLKEIQRVAKKAHTLLDCRGMSRTDMVVGEDGKVYVLEVNTIPGLTKTSLLPQEAKAKKIMLPELISRIIESGLRAHSVDIAKSSEHGEFSS